MRRKSEHDEVQSFAEFDTVALREALASELRTLRVRHGYTQREVAASLGVPRSAVSEIETGKRDVSAAEIAIYARLFGVRPERLLMFQPADAGEAELMLRAERLEPSDRAALQHFLNLCGAFQELENSLNLARTADIRAVTKPLANAADADRLADEERRRLELGATPARQLLSVLEEDVGIKVIALDLADSLSGACVWSDRFGPAILVNRKHVAGRQVFTLAHEYFHLLVGGRVVGSASDAAHVFEARRPGAKRSPADLLADQFAGSLLMPAEPFRQAIRRVRQWDGTVLAPDLVGIARYFGVSVQAVFVRMTVLGLISAKVANDAYDNPALQEEILRIGGDRAPEPLRLKRLAVRAYLDGLIDRNRLAFLIDVPPADLDREIARHGGEGQAIRISL